MSNKEVSFVFPENIGDSIVMDSRNAGKYDVAIDNDSLIFDGVIKVHPEIVALAKKESNEVTSIAVTNGMLELTWKDGNTISLNLSDALSKKIAIATSLPVMGSGTFDDPVSLEFSKDFKIDENKLSLDKQSPIIQEILKRLDILEGAQ